MIFLFVLKKGSMMRKIIKRFTVWYVKRGYKFKVTVSKNGEVIEQWNCPWWVRPLLIFFSPSTYLLEVWRNDVFQRRTEESKEE